MQKHAFKESGKQRECLIKGVAKKKNDPKEQKGLFLLGFEPESGVHNPVRFCTVLLYGNTAYIRRIIPIDF
jgi:hypothetical protein